METKRGLVILEDKKEARAFTRALAETGTKYDFTVVDKSESMKAILEYQPGFVIADRSEYYLILSKLKKLILDPSKFRNMKLIPITRNGSMENERDAISIYQGASTSILKLKILLGDLENELNAEKMAFSVGLFSRESGTGCSSLAASLAKVIHVSTGKPVLYVSLCPVNTGNFLFDDFIYDLGQGASRDDIRNEKINSIDNVEFLYSLWKGIDFPLEHMISESMGVSYLNTGEVNSMVMEINWEMAKNLLIGAKKVGFEYVIFDIGNNINRNSQSIGENLDSLVMVLKEEEIRNKKELLAVAEKFIPGRGDIHFAGITDEETEEFIHAIPKCKNMVPGILDRDYGTQVINLFSAISKGGD